MIMFGEGVKSTYNGQKRRFFNSMLDIGFLFLLSTLNNQTNVHASTFIEVLFYNGTKYNKYTLHPYLHNIHQLHQLA